MNLTDQLDKRARYPVQRVVFQTRSLATQVVACLTMPHPRLHVSYRVVQAFQARVVKPNVGHEEYELVKDGGSQVRPASRVSCERL